MRLRNQLWLFNVLIFSTFSLISRCAILKNAEGPSNGFTPQSAILYTAINSPAEITILLNDKSSL